MSKYKTEGLEDKQQGKIETRTLRWDKGANINSGRIQVINAEGCCLSLFSCTELQFIQTKGISH